jgi:hypothetical protein
MVTSGPFQRNARRTFSANALPIKTASTRWFDAGAPAVQSDEERTVGIV